MEIGSKFLMLANGSIYRGYEHRHIAHRLFNKKRATQIDFDALMGTFYGKDNQFNKFEKYLKDHNIAWGRITDDTLILFNSPVPSEKQINAAESYAIEHQLNFQYHPITVRAISHI